MTKQQTGDERKVVGRKDDVAAVPMAGEGIQDVMKRVLVSPAEGWDGWVMRLFDVEPGGHTPRHAHDWPHINFIAAGSGMLHLDGEDYVIAAGSYAYVPAGHVHQFSASDAEPLSFVCIVPEHGDG
jgi:quercetin dioxygenase-like cupin family protein